MKKLSFLLLVALLIGCGGGGGGGGTSGSGDGGNNGGGGLDPVVAEQPRCSLPGGTYAGSQTVVITSATAGASIRYTTDGTTPTSTLGNSLANGGSVPVTSSITLRAIAYKDGWLDSPIRTEIYVITPPIVASPTFEPPSATYTTPRPVTISTPSLGSRIRYTTDGSVPTRTNGTEIMNGEIVYVPGAMTLKAIAFLPGHTDSPVAVATYQIVSQGVFAPIFYPPGGIYGATQNVAITSLTPGAIIRYTTDGTSPSRTNGTEYIPGSGISVTADVALQAIAYQDGKVDSPVIMSLYVLAPPSGAKPMISVYASRNVALQNDGTVWAWGQYVPGPIDLGFGMTANPVPGKVTTPAGVVQVATTYIRTYTLINDGTVWFSAMSDPPQKVEGLGEVVSIDAGFGFAAALRRDGTVWTWGENSQVENWPSLGYRWVTSQFPARIQDLTGVIAISCGYRHTLALKADKTLWGWGINREGQLGDGTIYPNFRDHFLPYNVSNLSGVIGIVAGDSTSFAISQTDGGVWGCGRNTIGTLGDGNSGGGGELFVSTAVKAVGITDVKMVSVVATHTAAIKTGGTIWTWGSNYYGELGIGTTTMSAVPLQVPGITTASAVAAGGGYTLSLMDDGTVWAWGANSYGQLGDGTTAEKHSPVQVLGEGGIGFLKLK